MQHMAVCDDAIIAAAELLAKMTRSDNTNCAKLLLKPDSVDLIIDLLKHQDTACMAGGCQLLGALCGRSKRTAEQLLGKGVHLLLSSALGEDLAGAQDDAQRALRARLLAAASHAVADIAKHGQVLQVRWHLPLDPVCMPGLVLVASSIKLVV